MSGESSVKVKLPLMAWGSLIGAIAAGAMAWGTTRQDVARNTDDIRSLQNDARTSRELLVRIDENVKQLKEAQHR